MNKSRNRNTVSAFSLLELLVVVVVLALLAALLFPALAAAKRKAKEKICLNNLRQLSVRIALYLQHNNMRFPLRISEKGSTGNPPNPKGSRDDWFPILQSIF